MSTVARDRVLATFELFENILANLDMRTLLLCQRLNKHTKTLIDRSPLLQQSLFFRLAPTATTGRRFGREGFNTLITSRPQLFPDPGGITILIESYNTYEYQPEIVATRHCTFKVEVEDVRGEETRARSWQKMYLLQPPHRLGRLELRLGGREAVVVNVPGNVTCGEMWRILARALREKGTEGWVDGVMLSAAEAAL